MNERHKTLKVKEVILVVEAKDKNKIKNSPINKISAEEDEVNGEELSQATQTLSASSLANMAIM